MKKILLLAAVMAGVYVGCKAELFGKRSANVTIINDSHDAVYASGKHGGDITIQAGKEGTVTVKLHEPSRHEAFLKIRAFSPQSTVLTITGNDIDTQDITIKEGDEKKDITVSSKSGGHTKKRKRDESEEREEGERSNKKNKKERHEKEEEEGEEEEDQD